MSYSNTLDVICDSGLELGWYRFRGAAGNMMPTLCVPMNKCGTQVTGWFQGRHPSSSEGGIRAIVCFHGPSGCCQWSSYIGVRNCGSFYVYELASAPFCNLRYCGNGGHGKYWSFVLTSSHTYIILVLAQKKIKIQNNADLTRNSAPMLTSFLVKSALFCIFIFFSAKTSIIYVCGGI